MIQLIASSIGLMLIMFVLFSYEDEEKKFKNWIDDAWVFLAEKERTFVDRITYFVNTLTTGLSIGLDRLYGPVPLSIRSYAASTCFCAAIGILVSMYLFNELFFPYLGSLLFSLFFLMPFFFRRYFYALAVAAFLSANLFLYLWWEGTPGAWDIPIDGEDVALLFCAGLLSASIADFFAIAMTRWCLSRAIEANSLLSKTAYLLLTVVSGCLLSIFSMSIALELAVAFSAPAIFVTLSFFVVLTSAVILGFIASVLPRGMYLAIKFRVIDNKKTSMSIGILLMGTQFPQTTAVIGRISKMLMG